MNFYTFIFILLLSSVAHAGQSWSVAPKIDLMVFCEGSENKSTEDLAVVLDRARSDSDFIYIQILFQNANYETRHKVLLLLAERPLKERQMAFKAALAWNNVWAPAKRKRRLYEEYQKFVSEAVIFAHNIGISTNSVDLLDLNQRRHLILQLEQSNEVDTSKVQTEKKFNSETHHFTHAVPAPNEKKLQPSSAVMWSAFAAIALAFGWLLARKSRQKL